MSTATPRQNPRTISWPPRLRAFSFAITCGVVAVESVMTSIPIAFALWFFDVASVTALAEIFGVIGVVVTLAIAVPSHLKPARLDRRALKENAA